jgi:hypothetical protein
MIMRPFKTGNSGRRTRLACRLGDKSETHEGALTGSGRRKTAGGSADEQHR